MQEELKEIKEHVSELNNKVNKLDGDFRLVVLDLKNQITNTNNFLSEISGSLKELAKNSVSAKDLDNKILTHERDCSKLIAEKVNAILDQRLGRYTFYLIGTVGVQVILTAIFLFFKLK